MRVVQELVRDGPGFRFADPKSARSRRSIRLPVEVVGELRTLRRQQVAERLGRGPCAKGGECRHQHCPSWHDHGLVFCQPNGKPGHGNNISRRVMRNVIRRASIPRARFHDLRHAHGSLLAASGVNLKIITERLGHATEAFTLSRYIQATDMRPSSRHVCCLISL